jgi:mannose-1-phosphate guanylyltransferase/phosphomannomutase
MAGGEGSRLRPLTGNVPKPMLPVANRPLMEHIVLLCKQHGFTDVIATVQFLSSVIRNYFGDGTDLGVSLSYTTEEVPLGTAGSVRAAQDLLSGTFLVISGDALTDLDLTAVVDYHREKGAAATMVLKRMRDPLEFGIVMTAEDGRIERFLEKPSWGQVFTDTINTGIYVLEPEVLDMIPPEQSFDFSSEVFPQMLDKGLPLYGYITDSYWTDVGNTDAFLQANRDVLARRVKVDIPGFELRPGVSIGEDVEVHPTARIEGPALIGDNSRLGAGAVIGPYAVVGANVLIEDGTKTSQGVILDRAHLAQNASVRGGVLGRGASLGRGATLEEGAVTGDEVSIGAGAIVKSRVKIYPSRTVDAGAIVTESIVFERRGTRSLFGAHGVSGIVNVGITPQVAVRLAMAYGTTLKRGSVVVTGRDTSRAARAIKRAIIAGLNSTGVTVHDLELVPLPLTRFTVRSQQSSGGISVRTSPRDPEVIEIRLFDAGGSDLGEALQRKIERVFYREDYRRPSPTKLGELEFPARALEQYTSGLLGSVDVSAVRASAPKVVVDYAYGPAALVGPSLLGRLGCDALSVRAFTDEQRPSLVAADMDRLLDELADHVKNSGSDMGVLLEPGGEIAHLVDDRGRRLSHMQALLLFLSQETTEGGAVALPVSAPDVCGEIVERKGGQVAWTATSLASLMAEASGPGIGFAGNAEGALLFPSFMPAPDGVMTFCRALQAIATSGRTLADLVDLLPAVHVATRAVQTPWHRKGAVMRTVASSAPADRLTLLDGVKVEEPDGWALVIPDPDEPLCRIWAEGNSHQEAERIADRYAALVYEVTHEQN